MESLTFKQLMAISHVLPVLFVMSVVCIMVMFERLFYYLRYGRIDGSALDKIRTLVKANQWTEAKRMAHESPALVMQSVGAQLDSVHLPRSERESLILYYHQKSQAQLQRRLWIFGTLSFICPLIGLLGTCLGVIRSFHDLARAGSGGPTIVAAGISEALIATSAGITVAIVAAMIYNWFNVWMKNTLSNTDIFGQELIFLTANK